MVRLLSCYPLLPRPKILRTRRRGTPLSSGSDVDTGWSASRISECFLRNFRKAEFFCPSNDGLTACFWLSPADVPSSSLVMAGCDPPPLENLVFISSSRATGKTGTSGCCNAILSHPLHVIFDGINWSTNSSNFMLLEPGVPTRKDWLTLQVLSWYSSCRVLIRASWHSNEPSFKTLSKMSRLSLA